MTSSPSNSNLLRRWQLGLLAVGAIGLGGCALLSWGDWDELRFAWLLGFLPAWEASVGCLGVLMLHHLTGGRWGQAVRPVMEAGASLLPLVALAFVPIALSVEEMYPWATSDAASDPLIAKKSAYLNVDGFQVRAGVYFLVWIFCWLVVAPPWRSRAGSSALLFPRRSALGLILTVVSVSFAAMDWAMSLEPHWFSSMYGAIYVISSTAIAMSLAAFIVAGFPDLARTLSGPAAGVRADLGSLMLAMLMVWAYFSFSQFLIIWAADLPEENFWYLNRAKNGWQFFPPVILLTGFLLPFFALLSTAVKKHPRRLPLVGGVIVVTQLMHILWMVAPAKYFRIEDLPWSIPLGLVAMPSLWAALWLMSLQWSRAGGDEQQRVKDRRSK